VIRPEPQLTIRAAGREPPASNFSKEHAVADPILWTNVDDEREKGPAAPRRVLRYRDAETGKVVTERVPARCSANDDYGTPSILTGYRRWLPIIREDGNAVRVPLTNAAAHVDTNTGYAQHQIEKAKKNGAFRFDQCPLPQIYAGTAWRNAFIAPEVLEALANREPACDGVDEQHMCKHAKAEQRARQERRRAEEQAREQSRMDEVQRQKHALDQKLVAALQEGNQQNADLIRTMMALMQTAGLVPAAPQPAGTPQTPAPVPSGGQGKKGG